LDEIQNNPSALHNTIFKKQQRRKMLNGVRPEECQYCWNIEDLPGNYISDRTYKSADEVWSYPYLDTIKEAGAYGNINPTYLEVSFENTCNFKCAYCSPEASSTWMEEIKQHGSYPTSGNFNNLDWLKQTDRMPILQREYNPYIEAFWKWWPELYPTLSHFRITGGEPLLSKNTWKVLDYIKENPNPNLNLAINTNLGAPREFINKLIEYYNDIAPYIKSFEIYTSCEASGLAAEYIRYGMDYEYFLDNVNHILYNTKARLNFMITFNILSVTTFKNFLNDILMLRMKHNPNDGQNRIPFMISYLRWPPFLSMRILPEEIKKEFKKNIEEFITSWTVKEFFERRKLARENDIEFRDVGMFYVEEIDQVKRLCEFMLTEDHNCELYRKDFVSYIQEYDKRRNVDFYETFPELVNFIKRCDDVDV
jgi:organic radical activating enzyme